MPTTFRASYSSAGANLWVVGPSGEDGAESPAMITTDQAGALSGYSQFVPFGLTSEHPLNRDGDYVSAFSGHVLRRARRGRRDRRHFGCSTPISRGAT